MPRAQLVLLGGRCGIGGRLCDRDRGKGEQGLRKTETGLWEVSRLEGASEEADRGAGVAGV